MADELDRWSDSNVDDRLASVSVVHLLGTPSLFGLATTGLSLQTQLELQRTDR